MFFRVIAFLTGLIAVIAGAYTYDSELSTAPVPIISGGLVMLIAAFNLLPGVKRCTSCNKKLPKKATTCHYCHASQPPQD